MNPSPRRLILLAVLLVVQLGLALGLDLAAEHQASLQSDKTLLAFDIDNVDRLLIRDADGKQVELRKQGDHWVLPGAGDFPVGKDRVPGLLRDLAALKAPWPLATTEAAATRFKVAGDHFNRSLTLKQGDRVITRLYLGTSPGYRKVNARVDGQNAIYSIVFGIYRVPAQADAWEDKTLLQVNPDDIAQLRLPDVTLKRHGDKLEVDALAADEHTIVSESRSLLQRVAAIDYQGAGKSAPPQADSAKPVFEFSLKLKSGEERRYRFLPAGKDSQDFWLKVSTQPWWFRVSRYTLDNIRNETRSKLVEKAKKVEVNTSKDAGQPDAKSAQPQVHPGDHSR